MEEEGIEDKERVKKFFLFDGSLIQRSATDLTSGSDGRKFSWARGNKLPVSDWRHVASRSSSHCFTRSNSSLYLGLPYFSTTP
jgi:hypothetical protein